MKQITHKNNTVIFGDIKDDLLDKTKGSYQESLIKGRARWSGSDLEGKARKYGASYKKSRTNLLGRIRQDEEIESKEVRAKYGKVVTIFYPAGEKPVEGEDYIIE